jgi:hypothetical protein
MDTNGARPTSEWKFRGGESDLQKLRRRLDAWRAGGRGPQGRIPEALWSAAVGRARRAGVEPVAEALRLNVAALRRRVETAAATKPAPPLTPAFVELGLIAPAATCQLEVEAPDGAKLSIRITGPVPDLAGLLATFGRRRA